MTEYLLDWLRWIGETLIAIAVCLAVFTALGLTGESYTLFQQITLTPFVIWAGFAATLLGSEMDEAYNRYSDSDMRLTAGMIAGLLGVMVAVTVTIAIWTAPSLLLFIVTPVVITAGYLFYKRLRAKNAARVR